VSTTFGDQSGEHEVQRWWQSQGCGSKFQEDVLLLFVYVVNGQLHDVREGLSVEED
jgi:hypothetical protein